MAFTVSPGVVTREIDLTTIVPETGTTAGAFAGAFRWGPLDKIVNVSSEDLLVENFLWTKHRTPQGHRDHPPQLRLSVGGSIPIPAASSPSLLGVDIPPCQVTVNRKWQRVRDPCEPLDPTRGRRCTDKAESSDSSRLHPAKNSRPSTSEISGSTAVASDLARNR